MISLEAYAAHLFRLTSEPETLHHLRNTGALAQPQKQEQRMSEEPSKGLSSSSIERIFVAPPTATTVRFTGPEITTRAAQAVAASSPVFSLSLGYQPLRTLDELGLPYCVAIAPARDSVSAAEGQTEFVGKTTTTATTTLGRRTSGVTHSTTVTPDSNATFTNNNPHDTRCGVARAAASGGIKNVVVVDARCGEAFLRGSDIYAPGITAALLPFTVDEVVHVCLLVQATVRPAATAAVAAGGANTASASEGVPPHPSSPPSSLSSSPPPWRVETIKCPVSTGFPFEKLFPDLGIEQPSSGAGDGRRSEKPVIRLVTAAEEERYISRKLHAAWEEQQRTESVNNEEEKKREREGAGDTAAAPATAATSLQQKEKGNNDFGAGGGNAYFLVCLGQATAVMDWKAIKGKNVKGTALRAHASAHGQPSRDTIRLLLSLDPADENEEDSSDVKNAAIGNRTHAHVDGDSKKEEGQTAIPAHTVISAKVTDPFYLQNYSSMVPVSLLVSRVVPALRRWHAKSEQRQQQQQQESESGSNWGTLAAAEPWCVLDACAAPGGKTSLLCSLLHDELVNVNADTKASASRPSTLCRVVCCERSKQRHAALQELLSSHFFDSMLAGNNANNTNKSNNNNKAAVPSSGLPLQVECLCADVNKLAKKSTASAAATSAAEAPREYLGVLLDPSCTGLGLRPRLLPHPHRLPDIRSSADYQRKLFDSCYQLLAAPRQPQQQQQPCQHSSAGGGNGDAITCGSPPPVRFLVYSTCTISVEENEENVLFFLRQYDRLCLARAQGPGEEALCRLAGRFLLQDEITAVQQEREATVVGAAAGETETLRMSPPLLVLRFMPPSSAEGEGSDTHGIRDGVGFFVAVFEVHP